VQEFNGSAGTPVDPRSWNTETGGAGWGNNELQTYTNLPENVALDGHGALAITARRETVTGSDGITRAYTSARLDTIGKFNFLYGRVQARIKVPAGQGFLPAFWALGSDISSVGWPASGEIDMMEVLGNDPSQVMGSLHTPLVEGSTNAASCTTAYEAPQQLSSGFHVYGMDWTPGRIQMSIDGQPYATYTPADASCGTWVFDKPISLMLTLAVGGNWPGAPNQSTPFPAKMLVDWIRYWPYTGAGAASARRHR
jgi:beta-glucanase (GH16 family)